MRIIVVGAGKVGTALCRSLVEEKHDVILIEEKEEVLKRLSKRYDVCLLYTSPSPRDATLSRMPSSA